MGAINAMNTGIDKLLGSYQEEGECLNCFALAVQDAPEITSDNIDIDTAENGEKKEDKQEKEEDEDPSASKEKILRLQIQNLDGASLTFADVFTKQNVVLLGLLRHFG